MFAGHRGRRPATVGVVEERSSVAPKRRFVGFGSLTQQTEYAPVSGAAPGIADHDIDWSPTEDDGPTEDGSES